MNKASDESPDVTALFPAAGAGRRLGGEAKQFRHLGDAPLLVQTLRAFDRHPGISRLVVTTLPEEVDGVRESVRRHEIRKPTVVAPGGSTRQESVRLGLREVPDFCEVVLIHDAVRPFVSEREITNVIEATLKHGAASVAIPVVDTIRQASTGLFGATVPRDDLVRMQTPQGFLRRVITRSHEVASAGDDSATDDVELAQMAGHDVYLVVGSTDNFKITTSDDWRRAQQVWATWLRENRG